MLKTSAKIKRPLWIAGLNIALALTVGTTQAFANGGNYNIANKEDLVAIGELEGTPLSANYVVTESFSVDAAIGSTYVTGTFTGTFDGGGFTISGLTKPLFEVIDGDETSPITTISELTLVAAAGGVTGSGILAIEVNGGTVIDNVHVIGNVIDLTGIEVGGLVGVSDGNITNSSATGSVSGNGSAGGLVGDSGGDISNSYATGDVNGNDYVGGLVGYSAGTITDSYATGVIDGDSYVGGLVGSNNGGPISNSSATGDISGDEFIGGLVGYNYGGNIENSYALGTVTGIDAIGGLAGFSVGNITNSYATGDVEATGIGGGGLIGNHNGGEITNSYASGNVDGGSGVGGLNGFNYGDVTNAYATGNVIGSSYVGGFVGIFHDGTITGSYAAGDVTGETDVDGFVANSLEEFADAYTGSVNDVPSGITPLNDTELLAILNTEYLSPIFALNPSINGGRPYLSSNNPFADDVVVVTRRVNFSSFLPTQTLSALSKSVGFEAAKSGLSKLDLAFLDQVKGEKSAPITGAKLFTNQSLITSLSVGSLLQLEINFAANTSLQMWVKSSDGQYVLVGDVTFDNDGNAVLPGIEFKKSGSYEFIFVNSDKKDLTQPELVNKVSGLTVYVSE